MRITIAASPLALASLLGCTQGGTISDADALPCTPFETRACPCLGSGSGRQTCARSGLTFGACRGCALDGASVDGGTSFDTLVDAEAPVHGEPQPGSVCGVGLPALCAKEREKCCARSLEVDTCIADDAACACDLPDCKVAELHCDGPEDCAQDEVCCGMLELEDGGGAHYSAFACATRCTAAQNVACHERGAACPAGLVCTDSQLIPNVQICIDPASLGS